MRARDKTRKISMFIKLITSFLSMFRMEEREESLFSTKRRSPSSRVFPSLGRLSSMPNIHLPLVIASLFAQIQETSTYGENNSSRRMELSEWLKQDGIGDSFRVIVIVGLRKRRRPMFISIKRY